MHRIRAIARGVVFVLAGFPCTLVPGLARPAVTGHAIVSSPFDSLGLRIMELRSVDRYEDALSLARQLLEAQSADPAPHAWQVADTRRLISTLQTISAMPRPARSRIVEADRLSSAIDTHYERGDFDIASTEAELQTMLRRAYLGSRHPELVESLVSLAFTQWKLGNHSEAAHTAAEALNIAEGIDADHPRTGECLNVLGLACMASGRFDDAEEHYRRALAIFREQTGEESLEYTMVLENLGALCGERAEWALAEPCYQRCLSVNRKLLGPNHPEVARSLHNLGSCYLAQRDVLRARPLLEQALEIRTDVLGPDHPDVALTMHILSDVYRNEGDLDTARRLLDKALAIRWERLQQEHPHIAWNLFSLSTLELASGDYTSAYRHGARALAIWADSDEPMQYARGLWLMGTLAWMRGDLAAVEFYDHEIRNILADCNCGDYSRVLQRSAAVCAYRGDHVQAESLLVVAADVYEKFRRASATVPRRGWERVTNPYRLLAAEKLRLGKTAEAWPAMERWFARGLIDQLAVLAGTTDGWVYRTDQIQMALRSDEAIIGWLDIEGVPGPAAWGYVVRNKGPVQWFELAAEEKRPICPVGYGERFDSYAISTHAECLRDGLRFVAAWPSRVIRTDRFKARARKLWHERMEPLEPHLQNVNRLIVIPSCVMMGVPVEALIDPAGVHVLDRFSVSYVPSGTVLRWLRDRRHVRGESGIGTALLVGDPELESGVLAASHDGGFPGTALAAGEHDAATSFEAVVLRSALAGNPDALHALRPLKQSEAEVETIAGLVWDCDVLVGAAASENNLLRLAEDGRLAGFDLLHFATHAIVDQHVPEASALVLSQLIRTEPELPFDDGAERPMDGLLDVREITQEWRLEAELVTLSGCRTALGVAHAGEGYRGFAQAFLRAGSQSVIVSLWDVDDTATSMLMTRFYENLTGHYNGVRDGTVGEPMSKGDALREAKQWLRDYTALDGTHPFAHPSYWSPFILIGDSF